MEIRLKTLTPLWTGGADGTCDRLHETGIIGSMRWWYEAIVRGLGLYACDPNSNNSCVYDEKSNLDSICLVCQLFGCTGFSRRFRLVVDSDGNTGNLVTIRSRQSQRYFDSLHNPKEIHRGWRIPSKASEALTLTFRPMHPDALSDFQSATIYHTVHFIERYGALGAKTSHGQGVVEFTDRSILTAGMETDAWIHAARARAAKAGSNPQPAPNLSNFVGATIALDAAATSRDDWRKAIPLNGIEPFLLGTDPGWIPAAPAVRAQLRSWLRSNANFPNFNGNLRDERHRLMGTIQPRVGPKGSDIFVTHLYKTGDRWLMRIFGFVPQGGSEVDQTTRRLLEDEEEIGREVSSALGGVGVRVNPYPPSVPALLASERR